MKFLYEYKTSGNERREGEISAASRDDAYARLKKQGVKPARVWLAPGLWNRIRSVGKRWFAISFLAVLVVVLVIAVGLTSEPSAQDQALMATTRRQVIGDTAIIEKGIRTGWSEVFPEEGERFLASFAVPGVPSGLRNTSEKEVLAALKRRVAIREDDTLEARQIKAMVEGMKQELREFLADGGSVVQYGHCLVQRQEAELGYYNRAKAEIEAAEKAGMSGEEFENLLERRNSELRRMGIKLVSIAE